MGWKERYEKEMIVKMKVKWNELNGKKKRGNWLIKQARMKSEKQMKKRRKKVKGRKKFEFGLERELVHRYINKPVAKWWKSTSFRKQICTLRCLLCIVTVVSMLFCPVQTSSGLISTTSESSRNNDEGWNVLTAAIIFERLKNCWMPLNQKL